MACRLKNVILLASVFFFVGCTASTGSTEVGVRVAKVGILGPKGVESAIYLPGGTYFFFRPFSDWIVYDIGIQNLEMMRESNEGQRSGDDSLRFKTTDGNDISVNVTVAWRLEPERAPYVAKFVGQSTAEVETRFVRPVARTVIRDVLNQLTSEEYYGASRRYAASEEATRRLNLILKDEGVVIENILLGEHKFNPTYEQIIREKKIALQEAERLHSATLAALEGMKRDLEKAKGDVSRTLEEAKGKAAKARLKSDSIFYQKKRQAEAIVTEKKAKAKGLTEKARAMAGAGGVNMVKLKVADALADKKIIFLPASGGMDLRNTDMNALLKTYGAKSLSK